MSVFLSRLIIFCSIFLIVIYTFLKYVDDGLKKERLGWIKNKDISYDVLILGSSRAYRHFDSNYLKDKLNLNVYNLGFDAASLETQLLLLNYYLKFKSDPKYIVWEINYNFFETNSDIFSYQELIPIMEDCDISRFLMSNNLVNCFKCKFIEYLRHKELLKRGMVNYFGNNVNLDSKIINSNWPIELERKSVFDNYNLLAGLDTSNVVLFNKQLEEIKKKNITVIFVIPPIYLSSDYLNKIPQMDSLKYYLNEDSYVVFDYSRFYISYNDGNFGDNVHLNKIGVGLFLNEFISDFSEIL
tara:strand:+ start:2981 stop:3877 length:897 start_codon:yes stop_codon:yes gene_type:complete